MRGKSESNELVPERFLPGLIGRIIFLSMEEIIGREDFKGLIHSCSLPDYAHQAPPASDGLRIPFGHISRLHEALEKKFGLRGAGGIALRTGRACFKYGLREFGTELGITGLSFRLLPLSAKLKTGSEALTSLLSRSGDQRLRLEMNERNICWHIERCPLCWQRRDSSPACHMAVGMLQEALYWVSGGKTFNVIETQCIACGDATCTMVIDREPLE